MAKPEIIENIIDIKSQLSNIGEGGGTQETELGVNETLSLYVGYSELLDGTVTLSGTTVTGVNTTFLTDLKEGDVIAFCATISDSIFVYVTGVVSIASDTSLEITTAPDVGIAALIASDFTRLRVSRTGSDDNDGSAADAEHALATLQKAIDLTPTKNDGLVYIYVMPCAPIGEGNQWETFRDKRGVGEYWVFIGNDDFTIRTFDDPIRGSRAAWDINGVYLWYFDIINCTARINLEGLPLQEVDAYYSSIIRVRGCQLDVSAFYPSKSVIYLEDMLLDACDVYAENVSQILIKGCCADEECMIGGKEISTIYIANASNFNPEPITNSETGCSIIPDLN